MIYTKIDQFLSSSTGDDSKKDITVSATSKIQEDFESDVMEAPTKEPVTKPPATTPSTKPRPPGPIRRDKPSVEPQPLATIQQVMSRFKEALKSNKTPRPFNLEKLKAKYND